MDFLPLVIIAVLAVVWLSAMVHALFVPSEHWRFLTPGKHVTVALIFLTGFVGGTFYWLRVRQNIGLSRTRQIELARKRAARTKR